MALGKCRECKKQVSDEAKNCPYCGVPNPVARKSILPKILLGVIAIPIVANIIGAITTDDRKDASGQTSTVVRNPTKEELADKAKQEAYFQAVALYAKEIKRSMREPDSIVWESIRANDDASVICYEYRGRNGFGGVSKEITVIANGRASQNTAAWNKHCTHPLNDMMSVKHAL